MIWANRVADGIDPTIKGYIDISEFEANKTYGLEDGSEFLYGG
jgi:hypothetical protein